MSEELKPCPCGGLVYVGSYKFIDATLSGIGCMHCGRTTGMTESKAEAIAAWNRRAPMTAITTPPAGDEKGKAYEAAKRIVEWADNGRLADDEWLVERNETAIIAICRALLSSPDARREALEEAAKVADEIQASAREEIAADKEDLGDDYDPYSFGSGFLSGELTAAVNIAKAIRSLSPQGE